MIDRSLNYGRHLIKQYLTISSPYGSVLDIGAGSGDDLAIAREVCQTAKLHAIECYAPLVESLKRQNIITSGINIEINLFPYEDHSIDVVIANQLLEHTKEIF